MARRKLVCRDCRTPLVIPDDQEPYCPNCQSRDRADAADAREDRLDRHLRMIEDSNDA